MTHNDNSIIMLLNNLIQLFQASRHTRLLNSHLIELLCLVLLEARRSVVHNLFGEDKSFELFWIWWHSMDSDGQDIFVCMCTGKLSVLV